MMYSGWIGLGMLIGGVAATISFLSMGSVLYAVLVYSMGGSLVVLSGLAMLAFIERSPNGEDNADALPEIAHAPLKRAA